MKLKTTLKKFSVMAIFAGSVTVAKSQAFTENFDNITLLAGNGWSLQNLSTAVGSTNWFQGTNVAGGGPFDSFNGAANAYIGANYNNTGSTGTISNWLITPNRTLRNGDVFTFYTRKVSPDAYADRLQVRMSNNGASTNAGTNATTVGDFTTLLLDINPTLTLGVYPISWTQYTITISGLSAPTSGRLAFRYFVTSAGFSGTNSDYIGIDNAVYTPYVCPGLTITPVSAASGTAGVAYNQSLSQTGALGTPTYSVTAGALPAGLTLSAAGVISGTPTATGTFNFTVTVGDNSGCTGTQSYSIDVVCPPNSATQSAIAPLCSNSAMLTLTGGSPSGGVYSGTGVTSGIFDPAVGTQTVTYTYTDPYGCLNTAATTVTVNTAPSVSANASMGTVCAGDMETLTGSGANSYTWDNGVTDGVAFAAMNTTTYIVTGTDGNGCMNTASTMVTVNQLPSVSANASAAAVCMGDMETLTGSGANSYTWDNSVIDGVAFAPSGTANYIVTGTDGNGCMNTATTTVTVNSLPTVSANASAAAVCMGDMETLTGSGASSYTWDNSVADGVAFAPTGTTTYMVTGTDGNGCMNMDMVTITVNSLPTVTANASSTTLCMGDMETLTGGGATSYTWDNSAVDGVAFAPAGTTTYMVTGTDGNGCMNMDMVTITVNSLPTVTANTTANEICIGDMVTLTGSGANSYTWDNSVTDGVAFAPGTATLNTYMVTGTDGNGCMNTATVNVNVNPLPTVTANSSAGSVCMGDMETLTGGGATSYTWDNGVTDGVAFMPASTLTYNVTGTDGNGCMNTASTMVTVNSVPTVTYTETMVMSCVNWAAYNLTSGSPAGGVYSGTGVSGNMFDPATAGAGTYDIIYTYSDVNSCMASDTSSITVDACTGIQNLTNASALTAYPNPNNGEFTITADAEGVYSIVNQLGQTIKSVQLTAANNYSMNLDGISNGIYFITGINGNKVVRQKVVVTR